MKRVIIALFIIGLFFSCSFSIKEKLTKEYRIIVDYAEYSIYANYCGYRRIKVENEYTYCVRCVQNDVVVFEGNYTTQPVITWNDQAW